MPRYHLHRMPFVHAFELLDCARMGRYGQYFRHVGVLVSQSLVQRLLGMFTTIFLARVLDPAGFGAYSIVVNTANSVYALVRLGVDGSIHVHTADAGNTAVDVRKVKGEMLTAGFLLLALAGLLAALACYFLADWLATSVFGQPDLSRWISLSSLLVGLHCLSQFCSVTLAGLNKFVEYARIMLASAVLTAILCTASAYAFGISGALAGLIFAQTVTTISLLLITKISLKFEGIPIYLLSAPVHWLIQHIKFGFPFYASGLLAVPVTYYLHGTITRHSGLAVMGELRVLSSLMVFISFVPTAAAAAMISHLTRSSTTNYPEFVQQALLNLKYAWLFATLTGLALFTILPFLVPLLFGQDYYTVIHPASFAILSSIAACLLGVGNNMLFSRKRVWLIFIITACQMTVFISAGSLLIPGYGLSGFFAAELLGNLAALMYMVMASVRWRIHHSVSPEWLRPAILISLIVVAGIFLLSQPVIIGIRLPTGLALLILFATLSFFSVLDESERIPLLAALRRTAAFRSPIKSSKDDK